MSKSSIDIAWNKKMSFKTSLNGHEIILDAEKNVGGEDKGPPPKPFMLIALGGCTGMDVISILKKMRVDVEDFHVKVEGELTEEHPKHYHKMHTIFEFKGKNLPMDKIKKAVKLSEERYCGVTKTYRQAMKLTSEIRMVE
ncbi:MAG: OsmC family protein [Candidatus Marinimicrobia bacterium]|nr:OsmC family protein [Candidatus Neomarinimicrobiota bacterium]